MWLSPTEMNGGKSLKLTTIVPHMIFTFFHYRQYRNVLSPPFHFDAVRKWIPDFHNLVLEMLDHWEKISDKPVDITHWMPLFALDVLGVTVLSRNFNAMNGAETEDIAALNVVLGNGTRPKVIILGKVSPQ
jgi:cytochrome P450